MIISRLEYIDLTRLGEVSNMIKAFKEKIVGVVDDNERIRGSLEALLCAEGYSVKTYNAFHSVNNWSACDFWILDNETGERTHGVDYLHKVKNSVLYTVDDSYQIDELKEMGRAIDKMDIDGLKQSIADFFEKRRELVVGEIYTDDEITAWGYEKVLESKTQVIYSTDGLLPKRLIFAVLNGKMILGVKK